jgi:hypothetical protein
LNINGLIYKHLWLQRILFVVDSLNTTAIFYKEQINTKNFCYAKALLILLDSPDLIARICSISETLIDFKLHQFEC